MISKHTTRPAPSCPSREATGDDGIIVTLALFLLAVFHGTVVEGERYRIAAEKEYPRTKPS